MAAPGRLGAAKSAAHAQTISSLREPPAQPYSGLPGAAAGAFRTVRPCGLWVAVTGRGHYVREEKVLSLTEPSADCMVHVLVNGVIVFKDGEHTGEKPGRIVLGPGWKPNP